MNLRFLPKPALRRALILALFLIPLIVPVNFVIISPGAGTPLFPKVLKIDDQAVKTFAPNGQMYLLSIWVSNPDAKVLGAEVLNCWARGDCVVIPRSTIYERDTDTKREVRKSKETMKVSQNTAVLAAKRVLTAQYPEVDISGLANSSLTVTLANTGGPSGGLIFALGIIELLTEEDLLQGRKVSASGTISESGVVGSIGGISEKIIAAKKAGSTLLFASRDNCDDLPSRVSGISVVAVDTLQEALKYLQNNALDGEKSPAPRGEIVGCTNLRA
jgi:PDZ domain-containing protein